MFGSTGRMPRYMINSDKNSYTSCASSNDACHSSNTIRISGRGIWAGRKHSRRQLGLTTALCKEAWMMIMGCETGCHSCRDQAVHRRYGDVLRCTEEAQPGLGIRMCGLEPGSGRDASLSADRCSCFARVLINAFPYFAAI